MLKTFRIIAAFSMIFLFWSNVIFADADGLVQVDIGVAELQKQKIYFQSNSPNKKLSQVVDILKSDFSFYRKFFMAETGVQLSLSEARSQGIDLLVEVSSGSSEDTVLLKGTKVIENKQFLSHSIALTSSRIRRQVHGASDFIYQSLMGKSSVFLSRIIFVSDRTGSRKFPHKELYMMDFDGKNATQLTHHQGTVISPAISSDGQLVTYSLIRKKNNKKRNIELYLLDMNTRQSKLISNRVGMNSGAVFMPDNEGILLTLSHTGNAELFIIDLNGRIKKQITKHHAADVDPSVAVDGSFISFLSDRPGQAMIYTKEIGNTKSTAKRISYVGKYNATPRFSPDGAEIVFSSWMDNKFDLFRISRDGKGLHRLTKGFGSNEDPTYSPDGEFIAFTSQKVISRRKAVQNIYIMNRDGEIIGKAIDNYGNCISPRWSK